MVPADDTNFVAEFNVSLDFVADVWREANYGSIDELKTIDIVMMIRSEFLNFPLNSTAAPSSTPD